MENLLNFFYEYEKNKLNIFFQICSGGEEIFYVFKHSLVNYSEWGEFIEFL